MADIAELGIKVSPSELAAAVAQLDKLSVSAAKAEVEAKKLERSQTSAAYKAAMAAEAQASAAYKAATANSSMSAAQRKAAGELAKQASVAASAARANDLAAGAALQSARAMLQQSEAAQKLVQSNQSAVDSLQNLGVVQDRTMRNMGRLAGQQQANMTNIAAQFQDIGVTAAMGMNPLMIGLQQGAQLTGVWGSITGTTTQKLKTFGSAIAAVLSPMSLVIIGLTAGIAALLQFVNWTDVAKGALNGLADGLDMIAPYAFTAGAALTVAFSPAIISAIVGTANAITTALVPAIWSAVRAMGAFMLANPFSLIAAALVALGVVFYNWSEGTRKTFLGVAEFIIDMFVIAYRSIVATWGMLGPAIDDILAQAVQYSRDRIEQMVNSAITGINSMLDALPDWMKVGTGKIGTVEFTSVPNPNAGAAGKVANVVSGIVKQVRSEDNLGGLVKGFENFFTDLADTIRKYADTIGQEQKKKKDSKTGAGTSKNEKTDAEKFMEIIKQANEELWKMREESKAIGLVGEAALKASYSIDLMSKARQQGIELGKAELEIIDKVSSQLAKQAQDNLNKKYYDESAKAIMENNSELQTEIESIRLTGAALALATLERKLHNDEVYRGITLTDKKKSNLRELIIDNANLNEVLKRQREIYEFQRGAVKSAFSETIMGLKNGEDAWESFGNAAMNVLDQLIDKILNNLLDAIFQVNNAGGGLGGLFSGIGGLLGVGGSGMPSIGQINSQALDTMRSIPLAKPFAKGGAFTNSIVSQPTQFFAKGGAPGVMGEAGPEAIMPLKRGPDGSLGVEMFGTSAQAQQAVAVQIVPSPYFDAVVDDRASKVAQPMVVQGSAAATRVSEQNNARQARRKLT